MIDIMWSYSAQNSFTEYSSLVNYYRHSINSTFSLVAEKAYIMENTRWAFHFWCNFSEENMYSGTNMWVYNTLVPILYHASCLASTCAISVIITISKNYYTVNAWLLIIPIIIIIITIIIIFCPQAISMKFITLWLRQQKRKKQRFTWITRV